MTEMVFSRASNHADFDLELFSIYYKMVLPFQTINPDLFGYFRIKYTPIGFKHFSFILALHHYGYASICMAGQVKLVFFIGARYINFFREGCIIAQELLFKGFLFFLESCGHARCRHLPDSGWL